MFTKANIEKYFIAEKQESLLFVLIGVAADFFAEKRGKIYTKGIETFIHGKA